MILLVLCITRLWLMVLPSSFWIDEMATVFVVRKGASDPSLAIAPQVPSSIYYWLPSLADRLSGISEIAYRLPSVVALGIMLWLIARLATRLIHPAAGWFAVFACMAVRSLNYYAADARPYALGMCLGAAAFWFLVQWLDSARWYKGVLFAGCAALVWWVHLIYWPFYVGLAIYTLIRLLRRDSEVGWGHAAAIFGLLGLAMLPVLIHAIPSST